MKLFLEVALILGVAAWAIFKFYLDIDYGLVKAIVLFVLPCYALVLMTRQPKNGKSPE